MEDTCPICLIKPPTEIVCSNSHKTCKLCMIIACNSGLDTCPVCRAPVFLNKFKLSDLIVPYDYNVKILQHRFDDSAKWEGFRLSDSLKFIQYINLEKAKEKTGGYYNINNTFTIFWGDKVNQSIIGTHYNSSYAPILYNKQKEEIDKWKTIYGDEIFVQRNNTHTGMRLVRITDRIINQQV